MSELEFFYGCIPKEDLILDINETAQRLKTSRGYTNELIEKCEKILRRELDCRYSAVRVSVSYPSQNKIDIGFGEFESCDLYKNLNGCREAFVFAVTIGHGVDRLIKKLSVTSVSEHFITDALASAFAESACDLADGIIKGEMKCRPRFSPGYGDLPLDVQPNVLALVDAGRRLNITLGKTLLMSPSKSITAIMGIENERS